MGGFAQHYYSANNKMGKVWAIDREMITFDNAGGSYYGPLSKVDGTTLTTMYDTKAADSDRIYGWDGGSIMILNGTGEGQYRRITKSGVYHNANTPTNRTWIIDSPFEVTPDTGNQYGAFIQIYTFRGQVIWYNNDFADCGTWQTYGTSTEVVLASNTWQRTSKITFEGQWRWWTPASSSQEIGMEGEIGDAYDGDKLGGPTGIGLNPNIRSIMYSNTIEEGAGMSLYYDGLWLNNVFQIQSGSQSQGKYFTPQLCPPACWGSVVKGNIIKNIGGIDIGWAVHDCIVENNKIYNSSLGIRINLPQIITPVTVRNNNVKPNYVCCYGLSNAGPG